MLRNKIKRERKKLLAFLGLFFLSSSLFFTLIELFSFRLISINWSKKKLKFGPIYISINKSASLFKLQMHTHTNSRPKSTWKNFLKKKTHHNSRNFSLFRLHSSKCTKTEKYIDFKRFFFITFCLFI